jgi:riboflavin transporter FmnP
MSQLYLKRKSVFIAGTALLGAVVVVLDWTFKIAGLKIPFPLLTFLKFDVLGVPMLLSFFLFGCLSGVTTSMVAGLSISFRDPFSGFMKFLAEFSTIAGVYLVLRVRRPASNGWKAFSVISSILIRVVVMAAANLLLMPIFTSIRLEIILSWLPLISIFNAVQGLLSVFGGFIFYEAVMLRLPSLKAK